MSYPTGSKSIVANVWSQAAREAAKTARINAEKQGAYATGARTLPKALQARQHENAAVMHKRAAKAHGAIGDTDSKEYHLSEAERHEAKARSLKGTA